MLIEHPALAPLSEHLRSYTIKALNQVNTDLRSFKASAIEIYAADVFERAGELDTCLKSMRLAIIAMIDISASPVARSEWFRYHVENYYLRATGLMDRAYRAAGAVIGLPKVKLETQATNRTVENALDAIPSLQTKIFELRELIRTKKDIRNSVAHSGSFSSRELGLFLAIETLDELKDQREEISDLMTSHYQSEATDLSMLAHQAEALLYAMLDEARPIILSRARSGA